jgi:hypothetical protein
VLVDAGMGPTQSSGGDDDVFRLVGGQLPVGLRALGIERDDITDVVCTHLHPDHVGWLFDLESRPIFPHATIWFGAGDWQYFIESQDRPIHEYIRQGFRLPANGVSSKAKTSPARVPTFRGSGSDVSSTAAGSAGGRDAATCDAWLRPVAKPQVGGANEILGTRRFAAAVAGYAGPAQPELG